MKFKIYIFIIFFAAISDTQDGHLLPLVNPKIQNEMKRNETFIILTRQYIAVVQPGYRTQRNLKISQGDCKAANCLLAIQTKDRTLRIKEQHLN